jgi:hypothetical protein
MPRLKVTTRWGTLEVEGDPGFFAKYETNIESMLAQLEEHVPMAADAPLEAQAADLGSVGATGQDELPEAFGEQLLTLPKNASGTDQILLAGAYLQRTSESSSFLTKDANALLIGQGVKLSNASQSMANNLKAKRVFKVARNAYRVSKPGLDHLADLSRR